MEIRAARSSDIDAIVEVAGRSWLAVMVHVLSYAEIEHWVRDGKARAILSRKLDDILVAVSDDQLVGFVLVEDDTIREIVVRLENHRQGVGRRLVRAAIEVVRSRCAHRADCIAQPISTDQIAARYDQRATGSDRPSADIWYIGLCPFVTEQRMETLQHCRPLWIGLLACALTPTILLVLELMASPERVMIPVAVVLVVSLPASLLATYLVALPYTLWLRRRGKLNSVRICVAGMIAGAAVLAGFNFYMNWYPQMNDHAFAFSIALESAKGGIAGGAILGLLASAALVLGAGVPFLRSKRVKSAIV